ncbi:MAG: hypothetical protein LH609_02185 [Rudanella sp.]|nr:hypothetical protein [Rudanella sp.]
MNWNETHFPAAMRSLSHSTRQKAIEIANRLVAQGELTKQEAVMMSIAEARRIARQSLVVNETGISFAASRS